MKIKDQFKTKQTRNGAYSSTLILVVIAIVIVINLVAGQIPSKYAKLDLTDNKLYSIGEQTEQLLSGLDRDVTIYHICEDGSEDDTVVQLLEKYQDGSSRVKVVQKDPVINPNFTKQYTEESVESNSVIVVSGEQSKYISYSELYVTEFNYSTYSSDVTGFDGEGQLTSAVAYVTSDELPKMYVLEGHNELALSDSLKTRISKENIQTENLSLLTLESIPEDCDLLMISAPTSDLSEDEAEMIIAYLDQGGKVYLVSDYSTEAMPNFDSILAHYGLSRVEGIVLEGDANYYYPGAQNYLIPLLESHDITTPLSSASRYMILPTAQGIAIGEAPRDGISVSPLISTSDQAYSKVDVVNYETLAKESGDIDGPFSLAVAVTEDVTVGEETKQAQLVYVTTSGIMDDTMNSAVSGGNYDFVMNAVSWMMGSETASVSIDAKSLAYDYLVVTAGSANTWAVVLMGVLPVGILIIGIVVWIRRRRR